MKGLIIIVIALAIGFFAWRFYKPQTTPLQIPTEGVEATSDLIKVTLPQSGDKVTSPVTVSGMARGNWYFEASAPVFVYSSTGELLGQGHVEAQSDWMTSDFVPFSGSITFSNPTTSSGAIEFRNDNPSGDPARSKYLIVPVNF